MAPYRRAYNFTGEPGAAENPADWLAALETNIYPCTTNREKVDLFSSKLFRGSPARKWFNELPHEGHRQWHVVKQEFESRWCNTPTVVALLYTDVPTITRAVSATATTSTTDNSSLAVAVAAVPAAESIAEARASVRHFP
jgi:hypothetical protein